MDKIGSHKGLSTSFLCILLYSCVTGDFIAMDDLKFVDDTGIKNYLRIDGVYLPVTKDSDFTVHEDAYVFYEDGGCIGVSSFYAKDALDDIYSPCKRFRSIAYCKSWYRMCDNGIYNISGDTITANIYQGYHHIRSMSRIKIKIIDSIHIVKCIEEYFMNGTRKTGERAIETPYHFVHLDTLPPSFMYIKEKEELWDNKIEYIRFMNSNGKKIKHKSK